MWAVESEVVWSCVTLSLSALIAIGYCCIALNWYFQRKMSRTAESKAALARLRGIVLCSGVCGTLLYLTEMPPALWRIYDAFLAVVAARTWIFLVRMRGLGLVNARLAEANELERSEKRYREIAELLPHMVWTATAEGYVDFQNTRCREFTGDERTWIDAVHLDERFYARTQWEKAVASHEPLNIEVKLGGTRGYRTFVVRANPIVHGDAVRWLGACADIEDQKALAAEKELQAKQKSFFLNALSHDLRAPLHNVLLNAHLLKLSAREPADVESVTMIMENAKAAGDLVTRLLDFAKVGASDDNLVENISLHETIQQVLRRFTPLAEQKRLLLRSDLAADCVVRTDRQKLERIISNLVDNAVKYTSEGSVSVDLIERGGRAVVRVTDTGIGIPSQAVPHLFAEFYQVNNHERDRSKGFGMGLAICRCLARHIGGDVQLVHTSREGSCFELILQHNIAHNIAQANGADRRGRSLSAERHPASAEASGLCSV